MEIIKDYEKDTYYLKGVNVYLKGGKLVVCGEPLEIEGLNEEISHSCDYMQCPSIDHVLIRADITRIDTELQCELNSQKP